MKTLLAMLLAVATAAPYATGNALDRYVVTPIDAPLYPARINNGGDVAGFAVGPDGRVRAAVWREGTLIDLGTLGGAESAAHGINDRGQVVGFADTAAGGRRAFLFENGVMKNLGTLAGGAESVAHDINAAGQVVGYSQTRCGARCPSCPECIVARPFLHENGAMRELDTPGDNSWAISINDAGAIAGHFQVEGGAPQGFVYRNGTVVEFSVLPEVTFIHDMNAHGHVVGQAYPHMAGGDRCMMTGSMAFVWASGMAFAGTSEDVLSVATGINDRDQAIGHYRGCSEGGGFLWEAGATHDLDSLLMPGEDWHVLDALAINDRGRILGHAVRRSTNTNHLVVLDPVPSPGRLVAVEHYHAGFGHYFVTSSADETVVLDAGIIAGWTRTGLAFGVHPTATPGAADVCRFWSGQTFAPKSSHFYSPFAWECAIVKGNRDWQFEGESFAVVLPDLLGRCPSGTVGLRRFYNDGKGGAPNHRFATSPAIGADMLAEGWIAEGYGRDGIVGCVPAL